MSESKALAQTFQNFQKLSVRQRRRWTEVLLNFEMKNQYDVYDQTDQAVLHVQEVGDSIGAFFKRMLLGPMRPLTAHVTHSIDGAMAFRLERPFRFIFHRLEIYGADGERLGAIQRRWSWVRRIYEIEGPDGRTIAQLFGPFLRPWSFEIRVEGLGTIGAIQKKWSGLGREIFTDADNFGVDLANVSDPELKALAFCATVLIDIVHFERSKQ